MIEHTIAFPDNSVVIRRSQTRCYTHAACVLIGESYRVWRWSESLDGAMDGVISAKHAIPGVRAWVTAEITREEHVPRKVAKPTRGAKPARVTKPSGWTRFEPVRCDLCRRIAVWAHSAGGKRCNVCPRPEGAK